MPSEKHYLSHKLEFLTLICVLTLKFHDYLYGASFEVVMDDNPFCNVFSTAKKDKSGQW